MPLVNHDPDDSEHGGNSILGVKYTASYKRKLLLTALPSCSHSPLIIAPLAV